MVNDTEPRYRLVDANGNVVGSLYAQGDGTLALQEGTSGSDNEITVATDGTFNAPSVSTGSATIGGGDQINQFEFGKEAITYPTAASDATWDTSQNVTKTVTFSKSFNSAPTLSLDFRDDPGAQVGYINLDANGFTIVVRNFSTDDLSGATRDISWMAVD